MKSRMLKRFDFAGCIPLCRTVSRSGVSPGIPAEFNSDSASRSFFGPKTSRDLKLTADAAKP